MLNTLLQKLIFSANFVLKIFFVGNTCKFCYEKKFAGNCC